jgi:hypothetical protein
MSLGRTSTALGAFYRRLAARVGKAKAITATARKLVVLVYRVLSGDLIYNDPLQPLTTSSTALVNSSRCANAPSSSASSWSIIPPASYSYILLLERRHRESIAYSESCGDGSFCDGPSPLYPRR